MYNVQLVRKDDGIFLVYTLGTPPQNLDKTLYTGIYLPTFREGAHFIIKLLVSCLGAVTGPRKSPPSPPPLIKNKILYTGIYLPTFREGTC